MTPSEYQNRGLSGYPEMGEPEVYKETRNTQIEHKGETFDIECIFEVTDWGWDLEYKLLSAISDRHDFTDALGEEDVKEIFES